MITGKVLTVGPTADIMTSKAKKEGENASSKRNQEPENSPSAGISTERREPSRPGTEVHQGEQAQDVQGVPEGRGNCRPAGGGRGPGGAPGGGCGARAFQLRKETEEGGFRIPGCG